MTTDPLTKILSSAEAVLFDFDGPICSVFDGYPASQITRELLELARQLRGELEPALEQASSPHDLLLAAAGDPELAQQLEVGLQKAELMAIETARPTPGAAESIAACTSSGRLVAIVSNNYSEAVTAYLARAGLSEGVAHVEGRNPTDPTLMKPNPHLIERATRALGIDPNSCVFIGDQTTDIEAGRASGLSTIGYANKPGKMEALRAAGANAVLTTMLALAEAIA
ncbi:HAD family hydrolase [Kribbella catacumbae]|uniref:HAD family hydrolase n=1 Tax=Kribbella catacumbae TaxID=460086 RepID=UPI0012FB7141|nr:HAD family hydrolase [Kribbella catacumbae]